MSVSSISLSSPVATASAGSETLYSLNEIVPESVLNVSPVTQAGKDPLVAATLEDVTTYNKLIWVQQNTDWSVYEARFGPEKTEAAKAQQISGINKFASNILFESAAAGVPVTAANIPGGSTTTSALTVGETPIRGDATTIKVKTAADGSLTAFKDGQFWKSFAAKSLTGLDANLRAGNIALQLLEAKQGKSTQFA